MYQYLLTIIFAFSLLSCSLNAVAFEDATVSVSKIYLLDVEQDSQITDIDVEHFFVNNIKNYLFSFDNVFELTAYKLPCVLNTYQTWLIRAPPQFTS